MCVRVCVRVRACMRVCVCVCVCECECKWSVCVCKCPSHSLGGRIQSLLVLFKFDMYSLKNTDLLPQLADLRVKFVVSAYVHT